MTALAGTAGSIYHLRDEKEVKQHWARSVLGWVTEMEHRFLRRKRKKNEATSMRKKGEDPRRRE